jgi:hypothetical protein
MTRSRFRLRRLAGLVVAPVLAALAVAAGPAGPAAAATPDAYGFAYLDLPSQPIGFPYSPDPAHQFVTGGTTTITRNGTGWYTVLFTNIGKPTGVAHVTAVGGAPVWCQLISYLMVGADEQVTVACVRIGWSLVDSRFAVMFSSSSSPPAGPGQYGYLRSDSAGTVLASYNSAAAPNSVSPGPPGEYKFFLSALGAPGITGGLQVTAVNNLAPARCKLVGWTVSPNGVSGLVRCFNAFGALTPSGWTLSYQNRRAITGAVFPPGNFGYIWDIPGGAPPPPTNFNSMVPGPANTVISAGTGLRLVTFPRVGVLQDHVQVTAVGPTGEWCGLLTLWFTPGPDVFVRDVICFSVGGTPLDQPSLVTYTSKA